MARNITVAVMPFLKRILFYSKIYCIKLLNHIEVRWNDGLKNTALNNVENTLVPAVCKGLGTRLIELIELSELPHESNGRIIATAYFDVIIETALPEHLEQAIELIGHVKPRDISHTEQTEEISGVITASRWQLVLINPKHADELYTFLSAMEEQPPY